MNEQIQAILAQGQAAMAKQIQFLFLGLIQNSQIVHSENPNDDHMLSRCFFLMNVGGRRWNPMHADVRQAYGTDFENDSIELTKPLGAMYDEPFPFDAFTDLVENYYRYLFGANGVAISVYGGEFKDNVMIHPLLPARILSIPETVEASGGWLLDATAKWHEPPTRKSRIVPLGKVKKELPQPNRQPSTEYLDRKNQ